MKFVWLAVAIGACLMNSRLAAADDCVPRAARIISSPPSEYPEQAKESGINIPITVVIRISLSPQGDLLKTQFVQSGGPGGFDYVALWAVRNSRYAAQTMNCSAVGGDYLLSIKWPTSSSMGRLEIVNPLGDRAPSTETPPEHLPYPSTPSPPSHAH